MKRSAQPVKGRPFVFLNVATTLDGKLAPQSRHFVPFGSRRDRELLLELRTDADALMAGARTVDLSKVNMGPGGKRWRAMRVRKGRAEYNLRIVVSGAGTLNPEAELFKHRFSPIIVLTTERASARRIRDLKRVADVVIAFGERELDFRAAFGWLRREWNVRRLLCEGGGELNAALFRAGLVDEIYMTLCPLVFCGEKAPTMADGCGVEQVEEGARFRLKSLRRFASELFLVYRAV